MSRRSKSQETAYCLAEANGAKENVDRIALQLTVYNINNPNPQVERLIRQTWLASQLLNSLTHPETIEPTEISMDELVESVSNILSTKLGKLNFEYVSTGLTIIGDKQAISRAITNLVKNAAEALSSTNDGKITVTILDLGADIEIRVADNGPGLPAEKAAEPFQRKEGSSTDSHRGFGLSSVQATVKQAGGTIELESTSPSGTSFKITLPKIIGKISQTIDDESPEEAKLRIMETVHDVRNALTAVGAFCADKDNQEHHEVQAAREYYQAANAHISSIFTGPKHEFTPPASLSEMGEEEISAEAVEIMKDKHVIILDDDEMHRFLMKRITSNFNAASFNEATSIEELEATVAEIHLEDHSKTIILVDELVGIEKGSEIARDMKKKYPNFHYVYFSGFDLTDETQYPDGSEEGIFAESLSKPYNAKSFARLVCSVFSESK